MNTMTQTDKMRSRKDGQVGYVIFNNPERRNAVSLDMWEATARILDDFDKDNEVRVVVLTGAGDKAFVSGADISRFEDSRSAPRFAWVCRARLPNRPQQRVQKLRAQECHDWHCDAVADYPEGVFINLGKLVG